MGGGNFKGPKCPAKFDTNDELVAHIAKKHKGDQGFTPRGNRN
jgi:hypothetical protein